MRAAQVFAAVVLTIALASWLDRRRQRPLVREVSRIRWLVRDADRERRRWVDQDTVEFRPNAVLWQVAELRGQLEHIEGRLGFRRRSDEYCAGYADGVRRRREFEGEPPPLRPIA